MFRVLCLFFVLCVFSNNTEDDPAIKRCSCLLGFGDSLGLHAGDIQRIYKESKRGFEEICQNLQRLFMAELL